MGKIGRSDAIFNIVDLFFLIYIMNLFSLFYSLYSFIHDNIFYHKQGSKLELRKKSFLNRGDFH